MSYQNQINDRFFSPSVLAPTVGDFSYIDAVSTYARVAVLRYESIPQLSAVNGGAPSTMYRAAMNGTRETKLRARPRMFGPAEHSSRLSLALPAWRFQARRGSFSSFEAVIRRQIDGAPLLP